MFEFSPMKIENIEDAYQLKDIKELKKEMVKSAKELDFERAVKIRDEIKKILEQK